MMGAAAGAVQAARDVSNSRHAAPRHALVRQGADEIALALVAMPDSTIKPQSEPGQMFEITPQEAFAEKTGRDLSKAKVKDNIDMDLG